jgi:hypothetical protein
MTSNRFSELMRNCSLSLTPEESAEGWHFCHEFDGLLVKGDPKQESCGQSCVDAECGPQNLALLGGEDVSL